LTIGFGGGMENKAQTKSLTAEFIEAFESRQGSSSCRDLLGMSLDDAREQFLFALVCA
jgi:hypothetical protein